MGDQDNQPYFCSGTATVEVVDGALKIENTVTQTNNWDLQPFILDWFNTTEGEDYVIRIWMKASADGSANLSIGTWGTSGNTSFDFKESSEFVLYQINHTAAVTSTGNDEHILFQAGSFIGTVYIQKVQILTMGEDKPKLSEKGDWIPVISNGDLEGDEVKNFFKVENGLTVTSGYDPAEISDGVGNDGSRGIMIHSSDVQNASQTWDTQFFITADQSLPEGTHVLVEFDYKADKSVPVAVGTHSEPRSYMTGGLFSNPTFTPEWQRLSWEGTLSSAQGGMKTIAFDLNMYNEDDGTDGSNTNYYFDNIIFSMFQPKIDLQYNPEALQILFPAYTNIVRLVNAATGGISRLMFPTDCIKVLVDGEEVPVSSVEGDPTGAIMIFLDEEWSMANEMEEENEVVVKFTNPEDSKYHLTYIDDREGEVVENFEMVAEWNYDLDILPDVYGNAKLVSTNPENGSFNLPGDISVFTLTFDKDVECEKIVATLGKEKLKVEPGTGYAKEITLTRTGTNPLADGDYTIKVDKVYSKSNLGEADFATFDIAFSIGQKTSEELISAITLAKTSIDNNIYDRYQGDAFTALKDAVTKYETEGPTYTAPSVIDAAIADLNAKTKVLNTHHTLCDSYDQDLQTAQGIVEEYAGGKFAGTDLYKALAAVVAKYDGKVLTNDEELTAAVAELSDNVKAGQDMFTEGASTTGDAGVMVLVERIRRGVEALKSLGVSESDELIVAAGNALTDDDALAEKIKTNLTLKVYEQMKDPTTAASMFAPIGIDEETGEEIKQSYDMSVFIKNPNIYSLNGDKYAAETVPGWTAVTGVPELNTMWRSGTPRNVTGLPEDFAFTKYHSLTRVEQTITDLPAGVYKVVIDAVDWDEGDPTDGFAYVKLSNTPAPAEGEAEDPETNFAARADLAFWGQYVGHHDNVMEDIEVLDGTLTLGVQFGPSAQYEFDQASIFLTAPAASFNYVMAYESILTNVESAKTAKVRALELYDLNGRRVTKAQKGLTIVKKLMSDGTIKTQKVVK